MRNKRRIETTKRRAYTCSVCGKKGHTKATCPEKLRKTVPPPTQEQATLSWAKDQEEKGKLKGQLIKYCLSGMINAGAFTPSSIPLYLIGAILYHNSTKK